MNLSLNIQKMIYDKAKEHKKKSYYRRTEMSKISKEGFEQIQVIKNALDSMYDKLDKAIFVQKMIQKKLEILKNNMNQLIYSNQLKKSLKL